jgi:hypothetical protein
MGDLRRMRVTVYISTVFQYLDKSYSNIRVCTYFNKGSIE